VVAGHEERVEREERLKVMVLELIVVLLVVEMDFEHGMKRS